MNEKPEIVVGVVNAITDDSVSSRLRKNEGKFTTILAYSGSNANRGRRSQIIRIRYRCGLCKASIGKPRPPVGNITGVDQVVCPKCGAINLKKIEAAMTASLTPKAGGAETTIAYVVPEAVAAGAYIVQGEL